MQDTFSHSHDQHQILVDEPNFTNSDLDIINILNEVVDKVCGLSGMECDDPKSKKCSYLLDFPDAPNNKLDNNSSTEIGKTFTKFIIKRGFSNHHNYLKQNGNKNHTNNNSEYKPKKSSGRMQNSPGKNSWRNRRGRGYESFVG